MHILALDPSTNLGWARLNDGRVWEAGVYVLEGEHRAERAASFMSWLDGVLDASEAPDLVAFEEPMAFRGRSALYLGGLCLIIEAQCELYRIPFVSVHVSTLKKYATGSGRAKKPAMIEAAENATGMEGLSDHEADAIHVGRWAHEHISEEQAA